MELTSTLSDEEQLEIKADLDKTGTSETIKSMLAKSEEPKRAKVLNGIKAQWHKLAKDVQK